ncbi:MAG: AraC family transcriptional regulator [Gemmatimonadaceae bacterium]|nr:AraC family transcriptional regulator [Gemmatimonadaceae bacterium]
MDLLSDLFREAGLRRRLLDVHGVGAGRALRFPCERSLGFHVVLHGTGWLHVAGGAEPVRLEAGDIALMARGCDHVVATAPSLTGVAVATMTTTPAPVADADPRPDGGAALGLVSGAYQLWHAPVHPLLAELPDWFVRRGGRTAGLDPVALTVAMLADELRGAALGRASVVHALLDVLFTHLLRDAMTAAGDRGAGWSHAVRDPQVRDAVARLHADPAQPWTLASLAQAVGCSRSALAERFRAAMGEPPLAYLRRVRLQRAMRLLTDSDRTLEQVAAAVGYGDAFGFSKAFKRAIGESPGEFRKRDARERALPWRFGAGDALGAG